MLTSESRILTTHSGACPGRGPLAELHGRRSRGEPVDERELRAAVQEATAAVIAAQVEVGIDIGNDGEQAQGELLHVCAASDDRVRRQTAGGR